MSGTIVCGVAGREGRGTARHARALSDRLGLRLVLVHAVDVPRAAQDSLGGRQQRQGAARLLAEIAAELDGDGDEVVARIDFGEPADLLAWVAAEEHAAMIVLGSRAEGRIRRRLRCRLADALAAASPVPVLVAPPRLRTRPAERELAEAAAAR